MKHSGGAPPGGGADYPTPACLHIPDAALPHADRQHIAPVWLIPAQASWCARRPGIYVRCVAVTFLPWRDAGGCNACVTVGHGQPDPTLGKILLRLGMACRRSAHVPQSVQDDSCNPSDCEEAQNHSLRVECFQRNTRQLLSRRIKCKPFGRGIRCRIDGALSR